MNSGIARHGISSAQNVRGGTTWPIRGNVKTQHKQEEKAEAGEEHSREDKEAEDAAKAEEDAAAHRNQATSEDMTGGTTDGTTEDEEEPTKRYTSQQKTGDSGKPRWPT